YSPSSDPRWAYSKYYTIKWSSPCTTLVRPPCELLHVQPLEWRQNSRRRTRTAAHFLGAGGTRPRGVGIGWPLRHGHCWSHLHAAGATYRLPKSRECVAVGYPGSKRESGSLLTAQTMHGTVQPLWDLMIQCS